MNNMYNDQYNDFYIVTEQTTPPDSKIQILKDKSTAESNFLRFSTCLQGFDGGRNRNRRLWKPEFIRAMAGSAEVQEALSRGAFVGEAGHPCPDAGAVTMARIFHIEPNRCSHRITSLEWKTPTQLFGVVETLDDGVGGAGYKFKKNIEQGIQPAFSLRSVVPQRKQADGSIDVLGPGRMICYDRVYMPSHPEAYIDLNVPVKNVCKQAEFQHAMESYCGFMVESSDKIRGIIDSMEPALESASYDPKSQLMSIKTDEGRIFIAPEMKYRKEINGFMSSF